MQEYTEFVRENLFLFIGFFAVAGILIWTEYNRFTRKYNVASVNQAVKILDDDKAVIVDVREEREITDGSLKNAKHIPVSEFKGRLKELNKSKSHPILVYCKTGNRSGGACKMLQAEGFENVTNLEGGIVAWETANMPLSKKR